MHWEHGVFATRSRGKSLGLFLIIKIWLQIHNSYRKHIFIQSRKERYRQCQLELLLLEKKKKKTFPTTFEQAFICSSLKKQESSRKTSISALLTMPKPLTLWITINCGKFWKRWEYQTTWSASWEICMQVRKQQLELDLEQQTGSK